MSPLGISALIDVELLLYSPSATRGSTLSNRLVCAHMIYLVEADRLIVTLRCGVPAF
jgi:hypothetical protein